MLERGTLPSQFENITTGVLAYAFLDISPVDYGFWLRSPEHSVVFLGVARELLTRFLKCTSSRQKNLDLLTDDILSQPFLDFGQPPALIAMEKNGKMMERAARAQFYRSFISVLQAYVSDSMQIFRVSEFSPSFLPSVFLHHLEAGTLQYITWVEVNAHTGTPGQMATQIMTLYSCEKYRRVPDHLGLLPFYREILEYLWRRPLRDEDYKMLEFMSDESEQARGSKKKHA